MGEVKRVTEEARTYWTREEARKVSNFVKFLPSPDSLPCEVYGMLEGEKPTEKEIDRVGGREREREEVGHGALFPLVRHPSISLSLSLSLFPYISFPPSPWRTRKPTVISNFC